MVFDVASLPREPDALIEIIVELRDENGQLRTVVETLKRALYGARSEGFEDDAAQLALKLEEVEVDDSLQRFGHGGVTS